MGKSGVVVPGKIATLFLEESDCQYLLFVKFEQIGGRIRADLVKVFDNITSVEVDKSEWPTLARFKQLLEAHNWAYDNDPDRLGRHSGKNGLDDRRSDANPWELN